MPQPVRLRPGSMPMIRTVDRPMPRGIAFFRHHRSLTETNHAQISPVTRGFHHSCHACHSRGAGRGTVEDATRACALAAGPAGAEPFRHAAGPAGVHAGSLGFLEIAYAAVSFFITSS